MWEEIIRSFAENPRNVQSQPITKRSPLWFYVYVENSTLYVDRAKDAFPSSNLSQRRKLANSSKKCDIMYNLYRRRQNGESVSVEASATTVNQVYWYGVFADMGY